MNKLFSRIVIAGIVAAGAIFAASFNEITVTFPRAVTVGSVTLPGGTYTMSPMETKDGGEYFVIRGEKTPPVMVSAQKFEGLGAARKTEITLAEQTGTGLHLDRLFVEGDSTSYDLSEK